MDKQPNLGSKKAFVIKGTIQIGNAYKYGALNLPKLTLMPAINSRLKRMKVTAVLFS